MYNVTTHNLVFVQRFPDKPPTALGLRCAIQKTLASNGNGKVIWIVGIWKPMKFPGYDNDEAILC